MGLTVSEVQGYGRQGGKTETFRGSEYQIDFVPKVKIELIVQSADLDRAIEAIASSAQTGKIGDGKIWAVDLAPCSGCARARSVTTPSDGVHRTAALVRPSRPFITAKQSRHIDFLR